ncbi:unnamed protein product, partial [Prorocentrum cordatum]
VRPATQARYAASVLAFAAAMGVVADCWVSKDLPLVDALLVEYFEQLFLGAGSKVAARYALAALAHRFGVSLRAPSVFPLAKGALSGWGKLGSDVTSEPLCWAAACLMAEYLAKLQTEEVMQAARGLVLQFDTFARMGLVVGASALVMGDNNHSRVTKAGLQDDTVLIDGQSRVGVAGAFVALASYNRTLKEAASAVVLPPKVTAHLPRHGGPSEDYRLSARSLADIQARGRRLSTAVKAEAKRAEARQLSFLA